MPHQASISPVAPLGVSMCARRFLSCENQVALRRLSTTLIYVHRALARRPRGAGRCMGRVHVVHFAAHAGFANARLVLMTALAGLGAYASPEPSRARAATGAAGKIAVAGGSALARPARLSGAERDLYSADSEPYPSFAGPAHVAGQ
jgi:hypothetical protein